MTIPRAVHVIAGLDAKYGGVSYSVPRLCQSLAEEGCELSLFSVAGDDAAAAAMNGKSYCDRRFPWDYAGVPGLSALRLSAGLSRALNQAAESADVIHNHGLWLAPNLSVGEISRRAGRPLVISPRGMLSAAARSFSRRKKNLIWNLRQGAVVRRAACLHATSGLELEDVRAFGLRNPVAIIPNGIDVPEALPTKTLRENRTVLSLGRIHPKKGLDRLLLAWSKIERLRPEWNLRIVGPDEGNHADWLRQLATTQGLERVSIEKEIYGQEKIAAYRQADLFVLPTLSENFGLTVAESLAYGTPVICTKGAPWSGLVTERCGWWIEQGPEPLAAALERAMATPVEELAAMGLRGRAWMSRDFSWERVGRDVLEVYRWLVFGGDRPNSVRLWSQ